MATKRFTGFLRNPLSEYANHDLWRFTHSTTTGEVPKGASSIFKVDETGYYDIHIQYGTVMIESKDRISQRWVNHGQYTISSATTVTTLPALLLATTPITPELQQELEVILTDAQQARDQTVALFDSVDGDFIYHNKNSVGVVSQSGGTPTGAIMQRGINPSGSFTRLLDGTLTMRKTLTVAGNGTDGYEVQLTFPTTSTTDACVSFSASVFGITALRVTEFRVPFLVAGQVGFVVRFKFNEAVLADQNIMISFTVNGTWY